MNSILKVRFSARIYMFDRPMALPVMEFQDQGYEFRKMFA